MLTVLLKIRKFFYLCLHVHLNFFWYKDAKVHWCIKKNKISGVGIFLLCLTFQDLYLRCSYSVWLSTTSFYLFFKKRRKPPILYAIPNTWPKDAGLFGCILDTIPILTLTQSFLNTISHSLAFNKSQIGCQVVTLFIIIRVLH